MAWQTVGEGDRWNIGDLGDLEQVMPEGSRGRLTLQFDSPVASDFVVQLSEALRDAGVADLDVKAQGRFLNIFFRKGFPWLAVIAAIIVASIFLLIALVAWRFAVESPAQFSLVIIAGAGLLVAAALVARKRGLI